MTKFLYFDTKRAILAHDMVIEIIGGKKGIHDIRLVESVVSLVQNDDYYPTFEDKLTHIVFSFAMNHGFVDGNKRSSIVLGALFLSLNGYNPIVNPFINSMENIVLWVAQKRVNKDFLNEIVKSLLENGEITEDIKLRLLHVLK